MKSFAHALAVLITLLATSSSAGAELVLRERATQHGAVVRLGDLADISAASSTETTGLANTPLLPAPAAGTSLFLNVAQLRELLLARGIRLDQLDFRGAQVVEIGNATAPPDLEAKAMPAPPTPQEVERRVERAIERHLQDSTGGGRWRVAVLIDKRRVLDIAALADELTVRGRPQPRSGRERFFVSTANQPQELAVTADVTRIQSAVVVKRPIDRGALVRATDVELREQEGNLPSGSLADLSQVVGKEAQRALRTGEIVQQSHLRQALQVQRGETVNVFVRTGGVVVRSRAVAREQGAMGDLITLETLEGKKRLAASVSGPGEVTLYATGGRATDYASLTRGAGPEKQRRRR